MSAHRASLLLIAVGCALWGAACGDDSGSATGGGGHGGGLATSATQTTGGGDCSVCPADQPICQDGLCASFCAGGREACATDPAGPQVCCEAAEVCCAGGGSGDFCAAVGSGCPVVCPDGSQCQTNQFCQLDVPLGAYACIDSCASPMECGQDLCCPLGSRCSGTQCLLPDLSINGPRIQSSAYTTRIDFSQNSCSLQEGCIAAAGERRLLRFDLETPNFGQGDLFLGAPFGSDLFEYSSCHDHFHFSSYARYTLLDQNMNPIASGQKQAFCLLDFIELVPGSGEGTYHCGYQGITAGWSDVYSASLPCQWVDITDVPAGDYFMLAEVNFDQVLAESDYSNNSALVPITIEVESCPGGCGEMDPTCCADGDPCGWASNGVCDCGGFFPWDAADCGSCAACSETSCSAGCTAATDACCDPANPCNLGQDGICQCAGSQSWDAADCQNCLSADPTCSPTANSCPGGCSPNQGNCCGPTDSCGWAGDGICDCGGAAWDFIDCSSCTCAGT